MSALLRRGDRVLVRVPDWLGDVVMAEPALRALHERVGELGGSLVMLGKPRLFDVFGDAFEGVERRDASDARAWRGFDLAVLFTNSFRSAWSAFTARIPRRVGYSRDARGVLLTSAITPARECGRPAITNGIAGRRPRFLPRPFGATCIELVQALGCSVRDTRPKLVATERARAAALRRLVSFGLDSQAAFVLVNVGGRADSAKRYPAESWGSALREIEAEIVLVAGPGEEAALAKVRELVPQAHACAEPLAELSELVALCERATLVATADSGPRHLANAVGAPLVVLFGPTDPRHTADHTSRTIGLRIPVECGPCHRELCPLAGAAHHRCMQLLTPAHLAAQLRLSLPQPPINGPRVR